MEGYSLNCGNKEYNNYNPLSYY